MGRIVFAFIITLVTLSLRAEQCVLGGTVYNSIWHPDCVPLKPGEPIPKSTPLRSKAITNAPTKNPSPSLPAQANSAQQYGAFKDQASVCINLGKMIMRSPVGTQSLKQAQTEFKTFCDPNKQLAYMVEHKMNMTDIPVNPSDWARLTPP